MVRMNQAQRLMLAGVLTFAFSLPAAFAQIAGARLEGIVKDSTQAVIPGVTVTVINEATNISYTNLTNETGHYVFVNLSPGNYTLTSELQGFKRYVNKGINFKVGDTVTINITLETGDISTEVVVSAAAPLVDVTSGKIGSVVQEQQVMDLPLNGRNPMMLFYLQAGTNPRDTLGGQQAVGSVDGLRTNASNVKVEGVWASDAGYDFSPAELSAVVPLEAVGEYRVTTSSASADAGRGSGAQVSVIYRSGTNSFHGSAYEFNRNTLYNANNFFNNRAKTPRGVFLRNQYGVSFGGPFRKNKTFFFVTWEGQREIQATIMNRYTYTETLRNGIFRYNPARANSSADVDVNGNPVVPFRTVDIFNVDPTRLGFDTSGIVAAKLKQIPLPNNFDLGDGFNLAGNRYLSSNPNHGNQFIVKLDHTINPKHQLTGSIGGYWYYPTDGRMFTGYQQNGWAKENRHVTIGLISTLKPTLTNEFRVGGTRKLMDLGPEDPANNDKKGNFQLSGLGSGRGTGTNGNPIGVYLFQSNPVVAFNFNDSLSWVKGKHTFKFGYEQTHSTDNLLWGGDEYIPAIYTLNSSNPANVPALSGLNSADRARAQQMVNDLTGTIGQINQTYNCNSIEAGFIPYDTRHRQMNQREWGVYFQDTFKAFENLTINYGLRWDYMEPGYMKNGVFGYPVGGSKAVLGISGPVGELRFGLAPDRGKGIYGKDLNNFGPHLGFTWDPFRDGKMSVSAYYRVAYDRNMLSVTGRLDDQNRGLAASLVSTPFTRFSDPNLYQTVGGKPPLIPLPGPGKPFDPVPFTREGRAYAMEEDVRTPYTQSWSLRIQREMVKNWFIQAAYVGNISVGPWRAMNVNQVEIRKNGFLEGFLAAQRNLAANGNPNKGEPIGVLAKLFAPLGGIPTSQNTSIAEGQAATVANFADTTTQGTAVRGGLVAAAGLPANFFRVNPQVLNASVGGNLSGSTFHGLKMEVGKRLSGGTYLQFAYTLGKALSDYTGGQGLYDDFRDNLNRKLDKTLQQYDSTHIMQANGIWELPLGPNRRWLSGISGWRGAVLGGWQVNGIFQLATSRPFTVSTGRYNLTLGDESTADFLGKDFNIGAKVVKGDLIYSITPAERTSLFANPLAGSAGGTPQRAFRGPLFTNIDISLFKNFRLRFLGESGNIQFRAEGFNMLNHTNFQLPISTNINSGSFGQIGASYSPRIFQFALRLVF